MIENKYSRWYFSIIDKAKTRSNDNLEYTEKHHIIPESFFLNRSRPGHAGWLEGDPDDPSNIVNLTAKEHFLCHWLLTKMTTGKAYHKMIKAFYSLLSWENSFQSRYRCSSMIYEKARIGFIKSQSERLKGPNNPMYGKTHSIEAREKMSVARKGQVPWNKGLEMLPEVKKKISKSVSGPLNGMYGKTHSDKTRKIISNKKYGKPNIKLKYHKKTAEHRKKLSESVKKFKAEHIPINNGSKTIFINPVDLQEYLRNGYFTGYADKGPQKNPSKKIKCWVKKDGMCYRIDIEMLQKYLDDGWVRGRLL